MVLHSKAPWRPAPEGVPYNAIVCDEPMRTYTGDYTAERERKAYGGYLVCESVAPQNVPIICAAPDLLEALEGLVIAQTEGYTLETAKKLGLEYEYATGGVPLLSNYLREKAKDAIAKAKGQEVK